MIHKLKKGMAKRPLHIKILKQPDENVKSEVIAIPEPDLLWRNIFSEICLQQQSCKNNNAFPRNVSCQ